MMRTACLHPPASKTCKGLFSRRREISQWNIKLFTPLYLQGKVNSLRAETCAELQPGVRAAEVKRGRRGAGRQNNREGSAHCCWRHFRSSQWAPEQRPGVWSCLSSCLSCCPRLSTRTGLSRTHRSCRSPPSSPPPPPVNTLRAVREPGQVATRDSARAPVVQDELIAHMCTAIRV